MSAPAEASPGDRPAEAPAGPLAAGGPGRRRRLARGCWALSLTLLLGALLGWRPALTALPTLLVERQEPGPADAIVVLAGDHSGGRVDAAARLFRAGHLPRGPVVLSGGPIYGETTWAELMAARAVRQGIPPGRLLLQDRSRTTAEDARLTLALLEGPTPPRRLLLVTSAWHSGRAARLFRREAPPGLEVVSCPADEPWPAAWWGDAGATRALVTELLKRLWPGDGS